MKLQDLEKVLTHCFGLYHRCVGQFARGAKRWREWRRPLARGKGAFIRGNLPCGNCQCCCRAPFADAGDREMQGDKTRQAGECTMTLLAARHQMLGCSLLLRHQGHGHMGAGEHLI